jgi:hypothetical protein
VAAAVFVQDALFVGFVVPGETTAVLGGVAGLGHASLPVMVSLHDGSVVAGGELQPADSFVGEGWAAFGFTFAGWLLAAVVVAGLRGVFKQD